ncbi:MAG: DUF192 domain-containing protein [Halobacteriota archaeon]
MTRRRAALTVLCALMLSAIAGCAAPQQTASHHASTTVAVPATPMPAATSSNATTSPAHYRVAIGTAIVDAEAADTPQKQEIGLMNRAGLDPNAGMLFLFSRAERQGMWMKNMRFPLDIVFITEDLRVEHVYAEVPPCAPSCPTYVSDGPILYALEVNAGFCARHNIVSGIPVTVTPS